MTLLPIPEGVSLTTVYIKKDAYRFRISAEDVVASEEVVVASEEDMVAAEEDILAAAAE